MLRLTLSVVALCTFVESSAAAPAQLLNKAIHLTMSG